VSAWTCRSLVAGAWRWAELPCPGVLRDIPSRTVRCRPTAVTCGGAARPRFGTPRGYSLPNDRASPVVSFPAFRRGVSARVLLRYTGCGDPIAANNRAGQQLWQSVPREAGLGMVQQSREPGRGSWAGFSRLLFLPARSNPGPEGSSPPILRPLDESAAVRVLPDAAVDAAERATARRGLILFLALAAVRRPRSQR
jgi:hypothetical protein